MKKSRSPSERSPALSVAYTTPTGLPSTSLRTTGGEAPCVGGEFVAC